MACARTGFFVTRATGRMSRLRRASCGRGESKSCEKERGAEVGLRAHLTAPVMDTCRQATNWRPAAFLLLVANHPDEHAVEGDVLELRHGANLGQHPAVLDPARPREDALQWAMDALVDVIFLGSATGNSSQLATAPGHTRGQVPPPLGLAQCAVPTIPCRLEMVNVNPFRTRTQQGVELEGYVCTGTRTMTPQCLPQLSYGAHIN